MYVYVVCIFKNVNFFNLFIPIVCVRGKRRGCVEVATIFLKVLIQLVVCSCCRQMVMKERKTFVFVPSRTVEVIGLKGTLKWTQGEESFYFVYYSMLVLLCLPNMEFHQGMKRNNIQSFHTSSP